MEPFDAVSNNFGSFLTDGINNAGKEAEAASSSLRQASTHVMVRRVTLKSKAELGFAVSKHPQEAVYIHVFEASKASSMLSGNTKPHHGLFGSSGVTAKYHLTGAKFLKKELALHKWPDACTFYRHKLLL